MASSTLARRTAPISLARVLWWDLPFVVACGLLLAGWVLAGLLLGLGYIPLYLGRWVFTSQEITTILIGVAGYTVLALPLLLWRWSYFHSIQEQGVPVHGQVLRRKITPVMCRVDAAFHFQGRPFRARTGVRRSRRVERAPSLEPGRSVTVLVHQFLPERSLICEMYGDDS